VSVVLLVGLLFVVALALAALGSAVLLPQGAAAIVVVALVLVFLGVQLLVFRFMRLRSQADEAVGEGEQEAVGTDADPEWRAWRG